MKAVLIHLKLSDPTFGASKETYDLYALEDELEASLGDVGQLDGDEVGGGYFAIFINASNIDALIAKLRPILSRSAIPTGSYLELRDKAEGGTIDRIALPLTGG